MSSETPGPVNQPQQERSRASMAQMLDAAALLLASKTFEELTIAEVVQQAGTSVGAFYGRFKDKDALLLALHERFFEQFERDFRAIVYRPGWFEQSIPAMVREVVDFMVDTYNRHQGVLRALDLKARMHTDSPFKARQQRMWTELFPLVQDILQAHAPEITHPNPNLAAQLGIQQLVFTVHELYLWGPLRGGRMYEKDELCAELTRSFLAYLQVQIKET